MRIVLSGGGTAGHINPALALADVLRERGHEVLFAGTPGGIESRLVPRRASRTKPSRRRASTAIIRSRFPRPS